MFTLNGQIIHVYVSPKGKNKDGEEYGGQDKVQILGDLPLPDGQTRKEMVTFTTDQGTELDKAISHSVVAPVAFWAKAGVIVHFIPKGSQIVIQPQSNQ